VVSWLNETLEMKIASDIGNRPKRQDRDRRADKTFSPISVGGSHRILVVTTNVLLRLCRFHGKAVGAFSGFVRDFIRIQFGVVP
jgi:hypothetical protein